MIDLDSKSLKHVQQILKRYLPGVEVKAFGSRVTGKAKQFSDLDLVVLGKNPIPIQTIHELKFAFSTSDLPIMIDIVDWHAISEEFREKIQANCETISDSL